MNLNPSLHASLWSIPLFILVGCLLAILTKFLPRNQIDNYHKRAQEFLTEYADIQQSEFEWNKYELSLISIFSAIFLSFVFLYIATPLIMVPCLAGLILIAIIDCKHQFVPDEITLSLLWLGLFISTTTSTLITPSSAILGAIIGYSILYISNLLFKLVRSYDGIGAGDFKILAMIGAWFGHTSVFPTLILASILATLWGITMVVFLKSNLKKALPFGPFLSTACVLHLIDPNGIGDFFVFF